MKEIVIGYFAVAVANTKGIIKDDVYGVYSNLQSGDLEKLVDDKYLNTVKAFIDHGEEIRIWYDDQPNDLLIFYFFCFLLKEKNLKASVVYAGDCKECSSAGSSAGSAYFSFDNREKYLKYSKELSKETVEANALKWEKLKKENSCCRIAENGEAISLYPDFRDGLTSIQRTVLFAMHELHDENSADWKNIDSLHGICTLYGLCDDEVQDYVLDQFINKFSYPLIVYNGTKSSDGDGELKLTKEGKLLLDGSYESDIPYVKFGANPDKSIPAYLPGLFPNILVNGNSNCLPHKYENVKKLLQAYVQNTDISIDEMIELLGEPYYTDGRKILNKEVLPQIYKTGKGCIQYKYSDSEGVLNLEIEYRILKNGQPVLMNLKELVKNYADYLCQRKRAFRIRAQKQQEEKLEFLKYKKNLIDNYQEIMLAERDLNQADFISFLRKNFNIGYKDFMFLKNIPVSELFGSLEKELEAIQLQNNVSAFDLID